MARKAGPLTRRETSTTTRPPAVTKDGSNKIVIIGNLCQPCYSELEIYIHGRVSVMPTRNVNLTDELDRFVAKKVKTGRYENASEVVRAGLRTLEREEQQYEAKIAALKAAIDAGDASGIAEGNVFGRVRKALKLPVSPR
jgi:antitoxin ParD1/3/4